MDCAVGEMASETDRNIPINISRRKIYVLANKEFINWGFMVSIVDIRQVTTVGCLFHYRYVRNWPF